MNYWLGWEVVCKIFYFGKKIGKFMIDFDFEYVILNYMFNVVIV